MYTVAVGMCATLASLIVGRMVINYTHISSMLQLNMQTNVEDILPSFPPPPSSMLISGAKNEEAGKIRDDKFVSI
jgi:hypothetical protein